MLSDMIATLSAAHDSVCFWVIGCLLGLAVAVEDHGLRTTGRLRRLRRLVRRLYERWLLWRGFR